ncbi:MAG: hypothetical protein C0179_02495, partial [Fervidicoccus sp.]
NLIRVETKVPRNVALEKLRQYGLLGEFDKESFTRRLSSAIAEAEASGDQVALQLFRSMQNAVLPLLPMDARIYSLTVADGGIGYLVATSLAADVANTQLEKYQMILSELQKNAQINQAVIQQLSSRYGADAVSTMLNKLFGLSRVVSVSQSITLEKTSYVSTGVHDVIDSPQQELTRVRVDIPLKPLIVPRIIATERTNYSPTSVYEAVESPQQDFTKLKVDVPLRPLAVPRIITLERTNYSPANVYDVIDSPWSDFTRLRVDVPLRPLIVPRIVTTERTDYSPTNVYEVVDSSQNVLTRLKVDIPLKPMIIPRIITTEKIDYASASVYDLLDSPQHEFTRLKTDVPLKPLIVPRVATLEKIDYPSTNIYEVVESPWSDFVRVSTDVRLRPLVVPDVVVVEKPPLVIAEEVFDERIVPGEDYVSMVVETPLKPVVVPRIITLERTDYVSVSEYEEKTAESTQESRGMLTILPYYKETFVLKVVEEDIPTSEAPPETPPRVATVG